MTSKPKIKIAIILAFITPYVSVGSGLLISWLFVHFHWLGVFNVGQSTVAKVIAGAVLFGITSLLTYAAAHFHWLPIVLTKLTSSADTVPVHGTQPKTLVNITNNPSK